MSTLQKSLFSLLSFSPKFPQSVLNLTKFWQKNKFAQFLRDTVYYFSGAQLLRVYEWRYLSDDGIIFPLFKMFFSFSDTINLTMFHVGRIRR